MDKALIREVVNAGLKVEQVNLSLVQKNLATARNQLKKELLKSPETLAHKGKLISLLDQYLGEVDRAISEQFDSGLALKEGLREAKFVVGSEAAIPKESDFWGWTPTLPIEAIGLANAEMATLIKATTSELKEKVLRTVQVGLAQGASIQQIQDQILGTGLKGLQGKDGVFRSATNRAETQARTISNELINRGALIGYNQIDQICPELGLKKVWQTVSDRRTSETCQTLAGQVRELNQEFSGNGWSGANPPSHPNAYLPGQHVIAVHPEVLSRHRYNGDAVRIKLTNGVTLEVTGEHPVLTPDGFVESRFLREGQQVFYSPLVDKLQHCYPSIDSVFETNQALIDSRIPCEDLDNGLAKFEIRGSSDTEVLLSPSTGYPSLVSRLNPGRLFGSDQPILENNLEGFLRSHWNSVYMRDCLYILNPFTESSDISGGFYLVEIQEIHTFKYCGHVYNLTSKDGLNVANGIITHNCRSRVTVLSAKYQKEWDDRFRDAPSGPPLPKPNLGVSSRLVSENAIEPPRSPALNPDRLFGVDAERINVALEKTAKMSPEISESLARLTDYANREKIATVYSDRFMTDDAIIGLIDELVRADFIPSDRRSAFFAQRDVVFRMQPTVGGQTIEGFKMVQINSRTEFFERMVEKGKIDTLEIIKDYKRTLKNVVHVPESKRSLGLPSNAIVNGYGSITFSDELRTAETYVHEIGHLVHFKVRAKLGSEYRLPKSFDYTQNVSQYGASKTPEDNNYKETFAEAFTFYVMDKEGLKEVAPSLFDWVERALILAGY